MWCISSDQGAFKIITEETKVNKRVISFKLNMISLNSKLIQIIEFMTIKVNDFKPLDESECSENGFEIQGS